MTKIFGITQTTEDGEGDAAFQQMFRTRERAEAAMRSHHEETWGTALPAEPNAKGFYWGDEFGVGYEITEYELED